MISFIFGLVCLFSFIFISACSTSPPSGNQVDGLPLVAHNSQSSHCFLPEASARRVIMRQWVQQPPWGPKLCMATRAFKRDVLRIPTSDLDALLRKHRENQESAVGGRQGKWKLKIVLDWSQGLGECGCSAS